MNTDSFCDGFLFDMAIEDVDSESMEWLRGQEFYQKWQAEQRESVEKYPCIEKVLEGTGELSLTAEEHEAVVRYLYIQQEMEAAERREYYRFGHVHANRYREEVSERGGNTASRKKADSVPSDRPGLPEWLDGFIQRLDTILEEKLEKNPGYRKLKEEEQEILRSYPLILRLLEGDSVKAEVVLSIEEQEAFEEFFSLQLHMDSYREMELYRIGQGELVRYFSRLLI